MSLGEKILSQRKVFLSVTLILGLVGLLGLQAMPKQEDPRLNDRFGMILVPYPGASAEEVERLVVRPLEDHLSEVSEIKNVKAIARDEIAVVDIDLLDRTSDIENAWDEVKEALEKARLDFPEGVFPPTLNRKLLDLEAVVLAVTGSEDLLVLRRAAIRIKDELIRLPNVSRVELVSDPGEQVSIEVDDSRLQELGVDRRLLIQSLARANSAETAGTLQVGERRANLNSGSSLSTLDEIKNFPLSLSSDRQVPLSSVAKVRFDHAHPLPRSMSWQGQTAVGVSIVPARDIDILQLGKTIRSRVEELRADFAPLKIEEVAYQPRRTEDRLQGLGRALLEGILSVAVILMIWMGVRMGVIVALSVPLISILGLTAYFLGGGVLHQISIAAFIIAVGQFVDNVIVIVESAQRRLDEGVDRFQAAAQTINEFKLPMLFATGTAIAAFLPMLASQGGTADFTFAIPLIAVLTLVISYFYAMTVAPTLAAMGLRPSKKKSSERVEKWGAHLGRLASRDPWKVVGFGFFAMLLSLSAFPLVKKQFFPEADRNEFVVTLELAHGTDLSTTKKVADRLEAFLRDHPAVEKLAVFHGGGMPQFYYNLPRVQTASHVAQFLVITKDLSTNRDLSQEIRTFGRQFLPEARVLARLLEQGPPVLAPVEVRVQGSNLSALQQVAFQVEKELREIPGTLEPRQDLGLGVARIQAVVSDQNAARFGLTRQDLTWALQKESSGLRLGQYRAGREPLPLVLRAQNSDEISFDQLMKTQVANLPQSSVLVQDLTRPFLSWVPAQITRRDGQRQVTILSDLQAGAAYNEVLAELRSRLSKIEMPANVQLQFGGQEEGAGEANLAIFKALPLAVLVLLVCLLLEFGSFRKISIVMISIPLVLVGIVPGLLIGDAAFGFMSLLGLLALTGIVVNNSILLFEAIEAFRQQGLELDEALITAIRLRIRPILLTTVSTVVGLIPLAFEESTLWPPLAWTMISGILASAVLSMLFIPALYKLVFSNSFSLRKTVAASAPALVIFALFSAPPTAHAISIHEVMDIAGQESDEARGRDFSVEQAEAELKASRRGAYAPKIQLQAATVARDRNWTTTNGFGTFTTGRNTYGTAMLEITQPLFDASSMIHMVDASQARHEAEKKLSLWTKRSVRAGAGKMALQLQILKIEDQILAEYELNLRKQLLEMSRLFALGQIFEVDLNQARLALSQIEQQRLVIRETQDNLRSELARLLRRTELPELQTWEPQALHLAQADLTARPDLSAFSDFIKAQTSQVKTTNNLGGPRFALQGRYVHSGQRQIDQSDWYEAGAVLSWSLFEGGQRSAETSAQRAALGKLEFDFQQAQRKAQAEKDQAEARIRLLDDLVKRSQQDLKWALEAQKSQSRRYAQGKISYRDLLEAEKALIDQKRASQKLPIERAQAYLEWQLVVGLEPKLK